MFAFYVSLFHTIGFGNTYILLWRMIVYVGYGECIFNSFTSTPIGTGRWPNSKNILICIFFLHPPPPPPPSFSTLSYILSFVEHEDLESSLSFILFCQNYLYFICLSRVLLCLSPGTYIFVKGKVDLCLELYPFVMKRFIYLYHSRTPPSLSPSLSSPLSHEFTCCVSLVSVCVSSGTDFDYEWVAQGATVKAKLVWFHDQW